MFKKQEKFERASSVCIFGNHEGVEFQYSKAERESFYYAGMKEEGIQAGDKVYHPLIMGEQRAEVIALVRLDSNQLYYVNAGGVNGKDSTRENALLCFDKRVGEKWHVNIKNSDLAEQIVTFAGIDTCRASRYMYMMWSRNPAEGMAKHWRGFVIAGKRAL